MTERAELGRESLVRMLQPCGYRLVPAFGLAAESGGQHALASDLVLPRIASSVSMNEAPLIP